MVEVIVRQKIDSKETLGTFISNNYYDRIIESDCDLYAWNQTGENNEDNIIFKYRKNIFTKEEQDAAYAGLIGAASPSQNRGLAAGPRGEIVDGNPRSGRDWVTGYHQDILDFFLRIDNALFDEENVDSIRLKYQQDNASKNIKTKVWLRTEILESYPDYDGWFDTWVNRVVNLSRDEQKKEAQFIIENYISDTSYAQMVISGIAGYFDRYPRIPYGRETSYTEKNRDKFALSYPYLQKLNAQFRELIPGRWNAQNEQASRLDRRFLISDTVFTTLTVNHNWRTACHRDAGDLTTGFSNICGVTGPEGKGWRGGQFILPEYRIAINLQPGDMLLVNNHEGIHGNDELIGDDNDRMTIVAYFREKMTELQSWEYEQLRRQYIEDRRLNKDHKFYHLLWNGINPNMWKEQEWFDYMKDNNMKNPYEETVSNLSAFF